MKAMQFRVTNRLGLNELFEDEIEAMERAARAGWSARVTPVFPQLSDEALRLIPGEVIEQVKQLHGAWFREHLAKVALKGGLPRLVVCR